MNWVRRPDSEVTDCRSRRVILVPNCVLNQNARAEGAAEHPAALDLLIKALMERHIGIIQMPCPEFLILGLKRGSENIRTRMMKASARTRCRLLAKDLVDQIEQYRACGTSVLGILGKNGSPTCGVSYLEKGAMPAEGVFIEELKAELHGRDITIPFAGVLDHDPLAVLVEIDKWAASVTPKHEPLTTHH